MPNVVLVVAKCLSVRLSVTFVTCIQTAEDIVKLLSGPGSLESYCVSRIRIHAYEYEMYVSSVVSCRLTWI